MSVVPTDNDVLSGRGRLINEHPGNRKLRSLVKAQKERFQRTKDRQEKGDIAASILEEVLKEGRFLMEDPARLDENKDTPTLERGWIVADREKARKKVMHALRDKPRGDGPSGVGASSGAETPRNLSLRDESPVISSQNNTLHSTGGTTSLAGTGPYGQQLYPSSRDGGSATGTTAAHYLASMLSAESPGISSQVNALRSLGGMASLGGTGRTNQPHNFLGAGGITNAADELSIGGVASLGGMGPSGQIYPGSLNGGSAAGTTSTHNLASFLSANSPVVSSQGNSLQSLGGVASLGGTGPTSQLSNFLGAEQSLMGLGQHVPGMTTMPTASMSVLEALTLLNRLMSTPLSIGGQNLNLQNPDGAVANQLPPAVRAEAMSVTAAPAPAGQSSMHSTVSGFNIAANSNGMLPNQDGLPSPLGSLRLKSEEKSHAPGDTSSSVSAGEPVRLHEWAEAACKSQSEDSFMMGAVDLAWTITKYLSEWVGGGAAINIQDIAPENLRIFVERQPDSPRDRSSSGCPLIRRVEFLADESGAKEPSLGSAPSATVSLGRILRELFSDSSSEEEVPPSQKRQAISSANSSAPTRAGSVPLAHAIPTAINRLIGDLLCAKDEQGQSAAITSLDEALLDLAQMKKDPGAFLFDQTPTKALEHIYSPDATLFGREQELGTLTQAKESVSTFVEGNDSTSGQGNDFLCEAAFLGGYAGSGKSSLLLPLVNACREEQWFVIGCKFDKQTAHIQTLLRAFDDFFGKWGGLQCEGSETDPAMIESFARVCDCICSTLDENGLSELAALLPNFGRIYPQFTRRTSGPDQSVVSSMDKVGSAQNKLRKLIHIVVESIFSAGRPMLLMLDDLQWAGPFVWEGLPDFLVNYMPGGGSRPSGNSCRRGLFIAGAYRSNEVTADNPLFQSINAMKQSESVNVSELNVGELTEHDVNEVLSRKLCLPWRYTRDLAAVVHNKTRGNPFFVIQFLRSIVSNKMLEFSVVSRRWSWDCDVVDMQMISDDVAGLLMASFNRLPAQLMKTIKIVSLLGCQVERPTIDALDATRQVLPFCMLDQMELAIKEGILERAGPLYQFTHDLVRQSIYESLPSSSRCLLHKTVGLNLLNAAANDATLHLLAVDQINQFCSSGGTLSPEERSQFANSNAQAAKYAIAGSSFERARSYIDTGIQLLEVNHNHWETQYSLSLSLYEMSASVSCISGDTETMYSRLQEVLDHMLTFEDSLVASSLLVKLLVSNSQFDGARKNCFDILHHLGEDFPREVDQSTVQNELPAIRTMLMNVTYDQMKALPPMTDRSKLNAMKFLNMLCMCSHISKPLLLPLLSSRMLKLTLQHGFCADSIVGLALAGYLMFLFTDDVQLAIQTGRVCEALIKESPQKHILRSRLCNELTVPKMIWAPMQSVLAELPELHHSAMMAGDVEVAAMCRWNHQSGSFWMGAMDLSSISRQLVLCMKEAAKHRNNTVLFIAMVVLHSCMHLSGESIVEVEVKSMDELAEIGETNAFLSWQVFIHSLINHFFLREYDKAAELSEQYSRTHPSPSQQKRALHVMRSFYEGIIFLHLARSSSNANYRSLGQEAVAKMSELEALSKWNWENKRLLLQAELHYLNGQLEAAEEAYQASIQSAREHKIPPEETLAYELFGMFCVENNMLDKGKQQLRLAIDKYEEWGARRKANEVQLFVDSIGAAAKPSAAE